MAAVDMFLKIDGIEGESRDQKHKGEIEVMSYSWGLSNSVSPGGGGGSTGKVTLSDFQFVKVIDKASPVLMQKCCEGQSLPAVQLTLASAGGGAKGGGQQDFFKIKLTDAIITSYQTGGSSGGGSIPVESISFSFSSVDISAADRNGNFVSQVSCGGPRGTD